MRAATSTRANAQAVIARLNPIIPGWAAYYPTVVPSQTFTAPDHYLWKLTCKWAKHSHPNKPVRWIVRRYFGKFPLAPPSVRANSIRASIREVSARSARSGRRSGPRCPDRNGLVKSMRSRV